MKNILNLINYLAKNLLWYNEEWELEYDMLEEPNPKVTAISIDNGKLVATNSYDIAFHITEKRAEKILPHIIENGGLIKNDFIRKVLRIEI
jgi:hypothetical protein